MAHAASIETGRAPLAMLHVFPSFGLGGQQSRFAALTQGLGAEFSHRVVVLGDDLAGRARVGADVAFEQFEARKSSALSAANIFALKDLIARAAPDILCTYNWGSIEAALANALGPRAPHLHFEDGFGADEAADRLSLRRGTARRLFLQGATVVVPSRTLAAIALERWKLSPTRVLRIENGIDCARFEGARARARAPGVAVGAVGALRPEKNHRRLIAGFATACTGIDASLTIIGEGPERAALLRAALESGAGARIALPGPADAPEEACRGFDVFALSSDTEQAPLALMEAMAAGLPVVATDVGDVAIMVSAENRPFIARAGDDAAFAAALGRLMRDGRARARLGAANREKARREFDASRMIARHRALYLSKAARRG